jgi:hypothetical protein
MPSWMTRSFKSIRDLLSRATPAWPLRFRAARKSNITDAEREVFERYGENLIAMQVRGSFVEDADHAREWLKERARSHQRRETITFALEIVVVLLIGGEILLALWQEHLQSRNFDDQQKVLTNLQKTAGDQLSILESQKNALADSAAALKAQVEFASKQETRTEAELAKHPDPRVWLYVNSEEYQQDDEGNAVYKLGRRARGEFTMILWLTNEGLKLVEKPSLKITHGECVGRVVPGVPDPEPGTSIDVDEESVTLKRDSYKPLSQIKMSYRYLLEFKCPEDANDFEFAVELEADNINTMSRTALVHWPPLPPPPPKIPADRVAQSDAVEIPDIPQFEGRDIRLTIVGREIHGPPFLPTSRKK